MTSPVTSPDNLQFVKMHGAGNDYVYVDGFDQPLPGDITQLARDVSDRHTGIGSDGLILILPPSTGEADVRMQMFNADGSEGSMCGNGMRCVAKYAVDSGRVNNHPLRVETASGIKVIEVQRGPDGKVETATVDMGEPAVGPEAVKASGKLGILESEAHALVSMGNPHAVIYVEHIDDIDLPSDGPRFTEHPAVPGGINTHFVEVISPAKVIISHWERGSGPTLACGTGACAVCVAGVVTGRTERELEADVPGGTLHLRWDKQSNHVFMTGPAVEVFRGTWTL